MKFKLYWIALIVYGIGSSFIILSMYVPSYKVPAMIGYALVSVAYVAVCIWAMVKDNGDTQ